SSGEGETQFPLSSPSRRRPTTQSVGEYGIKIAVDIFLIHLLVNTFWSITFFGLKNLLFALAIILILWAMIVYLIKLFWKINRKASCLLIPYLLWVSFATILNFSIWRLN
ncbi:MAG: tryptophan-rich sensory protein, partial [Candidatus Pacebacteria bacterium]|nr:tryptophan-rich sensory protein [Candidatus Paceibacterota bacterium]